MKYAIETLEIELNKWKSVFRQNEVWMYEAPCELFSKACDTAQSKITELQQALTILNQNV